MINTKEFSLKTLKLDLENPRIPRFTSEKDAINFLCITEKILELSEDIAENGLSPFEKLMVIQDGEKYVVKEGNRRLAALKLLDNPSLAPEHLSKKIAKYSADRKIHITSVECAIASDIKEANHWMEIKHLGQNNGKGVKPWNAIQKSRYSPDNPNRFAYLLLNHLLEDPSLDYEITTVTRLISKTTFFEYTGIYYNQLEDKLIFSCSYEENSALDNFLKQFVQDILEKKINSRSCNNRKDIEKYFEILSRKFGLTKSFDSSNLTNLFSSSKKLARKGKDKKETEYSKRKDNLPTSDANKDGNYPKQKLFRRIYDEEIADQLQKLGIIKPISIYSSVKKLGTDADTPLVYIAFSCLFEGLTGFLGRENKSFDNFLKDKFSKYCRLLKTELDDTQYINENEKAILDTLAKVRMQANTAKHAFRSAPLSYLEVLSDIQVLKPVLMQLINEVYDKKLQNARQML
ncbi:ParB/Srx family N-terminal domain-containing protein [Bartonella sp. TT119HLJHH]|uniref:ParB/Srx family N-terminal domain-containing protein n=1 Tax=Bartonella sp. TT119HLJHH TaxID=3243579 RepID=UPI0035D0C5F8